MHEFIDEKKPFRGFRLHIFKSLRWPVWLRRIYKLDTIYIDILYKAVLKIRICAVETFEWVIFIRWCLSGDAVEKISNGFPNHISAWSINYFAQRRIFLLLVIFENFRNLTKLPCEADQMDCVYFGENLGFPAKFRCMYFMAFLFYVSAVISVITDIECSNAMKSFRVFEILMLYSWNFVPRVCLYSDPFTFTILQGLSIPAHCHI